MNRVPLGEIADLRAGFGFPKKFQGRTSGDYPFAKVGDISRAGRAGLRVLNTADHYVDETDLVQLRSKPVPAGSTLFAKIGEAIRQEHRVMAGRPMIIDNNAMAAVPKAGVDPQYLFRLMQTIKLYELASSTTVPSIRKSDLEVTNISLPSLNDQRRIADILHSADALRSARRKAIGRLDALSLAIFHEMFGYKSLQTVELADLVVSTQLGLSRSSSDFGPDYSHPYVRMDAISNSGRFLPTKVLRTDATAFEREKYEVVDGDFLMNTRNSRELVGKATVVQGLGKGLFNNNLLRIRFKAGVSSDFVSMFMLTNEGKRQVDMRKAGTTSVFAMYQRDYLTIRVPLAEKTEQDLFSKRVAAVERVRTQHLKQLDQLDALFLSLQDRAFKGEL